MVGDLEALVRGHHSALVRPMQSEAVALYALVMQTRTLGGRLYFAGNGGSCADALHLAGEYQAVGWDAVALCEPVLLTALANDFAWDEALARALQGAHREDLLWLHSTSGESENLVRAAQEAKRLGMGTAALLAKGGGRLADLVSQPVVFATHDTQHAQEAQLALAHIVWRAVTRA